MHKRTDFVTNEWTCLLLHIRATSE